MALHLIKPEHRYPALDRGRDDDMEAWGWFCWELGKVLLGGVVGWVLRGML